MFCALVLIYFLTNSGNENDVRAFIRNIASVNLADENGNTALIFAAMNGNWDLGVTKSPNVNMTEKED